MPLIIIGAVFAGIFLTLRQGTGQSIREQAARLPPKAVQMRRSRSEWIVVVLFSAGPTA